MAAVGILYPDQFKGHWLRKRGRGTFSQEFGTVYASSRLRWALDDAYQLKNPADVGPALVG
jgi:hypothetical protein